MFELKFLEKVSRKSKLALAMSLFLVLILLFLDTFKIVGITGLIISDDKILVYEKIVNTTYKDYSEIIINHKEFTDINSNLPQNYSIKSVKSVKITGIISGSGSVYVSDENKTYLIVDESIIENSKNNGLDSITGLLIDGEITNTNTIQETISDSVDLDIPTEYREESEELQIISESEEIIAIEESTNILEISESETSLLELQNNSNNTTDSNSSNVENVYEELVVENNTTPIENNTIINDEINIIENTSKEISFELACIDSCNINLDKDISILISPTNFNSNLSRIYITSISIEYKLEKTSPNIEELKTTELVKISDDLSKNILSQKIQKTQIENVIKTEQIDADTREITKTKFEISAKDKSDIKNSIIIRDLDSIEQLENIEFIDKKKHKQENIVTNIIYVNSINITNATINISSEDKIDAIAICQDYNPVTDYCSNWETTSIPFTQENGIITFTVEHFTGYGGVVIHNNRLYVRSTTNTADTTAFPTLNTTQDGTLNMVNFTFAGSADNGRLFNFMNASSEPMTGRMIRSTDMINFSSYWKNLAGTRIDFAYATFKLFKNNSGTFTLICQFGNDSTGGIQIPDGADGLRGGNCTPSSNIIMENGSSLVYVINVFASSIANGGTAATRMASLQWDTATANTSFNYTYIIPTEINVSTNQSTYTASQNVNITGYFYWLNLSGTNPGNITITIFNNTGSQVYTTNITTESSGFYKANYSLPSNVENGIWTVNVTGRYNGSINATNGTTFSTSTPYISSCSNISSSGNYFLTNNLSINGSNCIFISASNIYLDCNNTYILGNNSENTTGVSVVGTNITIANCNIMRFHYNSKNNYSSNINYINNYFYEEYNYYLGVDIMYSNNTLFFNNTFHSKNTTSGQCIYAIGGTGYNLTQNYFISNSSACVSLLGAYNNTIYNNTFISTNLSTHAVYATSGSNILVKKNNFFMSADQGGAITLSSISNGLVEDNNIDFSHNCVSSYCGAIAISFSSNVSIVNNNISVNKTKNYAISLTMSDNATIINNNITSNYNSSGVYSDRVFNYTFTNNTFYSYGLFGLYLIDGTRFLNFTRNTFFSNTSGTIIIFSNASNMTLVNNTINSTYMHIYFDINSSFNKIYHNNFDGIGIWINNSNSTNMFNNTIGGVAQGNYYFNISQYNVLDGDSDGWGDSGSQYPINTTTIPTKWIGQGSDFGPFVPTISQMICQNITSQGTTTLTNNISVNSSNCFEIQVPNVILNCAGYTITGNNTLNTYGIYTNSTNVSITNCTVNRFNYGVYFDADAHNGSVNFTNIFINSSNAVGLFILSSNSTKIYRSNITSGDSGSNPVGLYIENSVYTTVDLSSIFLSNTAAYNIQLNNINNLSITNSNFSGNPSNIIYSVTRSNLLYFYNNILFTTKSSSPIFSLDNLHNSTFLYNIFNLSANTGYNELLYSKNILFKDNLFLTASTSYDLLELRHSDNITFNNNTFNYLSSNTNINSIYFYNNTNIILNKSNFNNLNRTGNSDIVSLEFSSNILVINNILNTTNSTQRSLSILSSNNISSYHNNFTGIGRWVNVTNSTNIEFNTSVNGIAQGNYYSNVTNYYIADSDSDGWADIGSQYPFNQTILGLDVWSGAFSDFAPGVSYSLVTLSARISPINSTSNNTILGYCNGTDSNNNNISYVYTWYLNGAPNSSTLYSINYTSSVEVNVANLSTNSIIPGQTWHFGCSASTIGINSTQKNSTITLLQNLTCINLTTSGTFRLTNNVFSSDTTCFNIFSPNVVLDCAGYSITGNNASNAVAIYSNSTNTTIENCIISNFLYGVNLNRSLNSNVRNTNFSLYNDSSIGVYLANNVNSSNISYNNFSLGSNGYAISSDASSKFYNIISNNNITLNASIGLDLERSSNGTIFNNFIRTNGNGAYAISVRNNFNANDIFNNTLITYGSSSRGIRLSSNIYNNNISYNRITTFASTTASYCIELDSANSANNLIFMNNLISNSTAGGIYLNNGINNNTISFNNISSRHISINIAGGSFNNDIYNNTINTTSSTLYHLQISSDSFNNTFYYNNLTGSGPWINNSNSSNNFNTSSSGARGNYYSNVSQYEVYDSNADGWGDTGSQYPFNATTVSSKWVGEGSDFGPATNRTLSNTAPIISNIVSLGSVDPIEESDKILQFNFTIIDLDGNNTINISSARTYVNNSEFTRSTTQCSGFAINYTSVNVSCNLTIRYYDISGVWSINVSIEDTSDSYTQNTSTTFTYNVLTAVSINSNTFDFGSVSSGSENLTTSPIIIRNTGNSNFSFARIKAYDLVNSTSFIGAGNFSINFSNISTGQMLLNDTFINVTNTSLSVSNDTYNSSLTLYIYADIPLGISALKYNSLLDWVANLIS